MSLEVNVTSYGNALEVRTGAAAVIREANKINITGDITAVQNFISKRTVIDSIDVANTMRPVEKLDVFKTVELLSKDKSYVQASGHQVIDAAIAVVLVDKEKNTITLDMDPQNYYGTTVTGQLLEAPELDIFAVNEQKSYNREQLIKLIRFNRSFFVNEGDHDRLLSAFQKFSVKTYMDYDKEDDTRGNAAMNFKKTTQSNIPLSFVLEMPIYKGQKNERFSVDICIESTGSSVAFYFESVQLSDLLKTRKDEIFANELKACTHFPIIYK